MPSSSRRSRSRGTVDQLPNGAFRVRVYAGSDPLTGKRHDLTEVVPAGPRAAAEAEKVRTRLLNQVDERRNPRTKATLNQLLDRYLEVVELEPTTRRSRNDTRCTPADLRCVGCDGCAATTAPTNHTALAR